MVVDEREISLLNSPIHNLSMCSLENFHTCFLFWLGKSYNKEFLEILTNKHYNDKVNIKFETQVKYDKNNILDLLITVQNGENIEYVVIENKLKSFPSEEQLKRYQECFVGKKTKFILLSLAPKFELPKEWDYLNYFELAKKMDDKFSYKNDYDEYLIKDYLNVITQLAKAFPKTFSQKYDFYENNELDEIGLKDIYIKYRTSELANYIEQKLNRNDLYIGYSFHNKKGTIDIIKHLDIFGIDIGIQIENNQYRYFMNIPCDTIFSDKKDIQEKIVSEIFVHDYWFYNTENPIRPRVYKNFCFYNPDFIYRYFQMDEYFGKELQEISYEEVTKQIEKDINNLEENQYRIIRILAENL